MRRGPIIHGVLLVAALLLAYQTWTREEVVAPITGDVVVWSIPAGEIQAITYEIDVPEHRLVRVERRSDSEGPYLWGLDKRTIEQYLPPDESVPDAGPDAERPLGPVKASNAREFMVGDKGDELFEHLSELRALRAIGKLDEDRRELYGLHEGTATVSVIHPGGTRSLVVGGKVFGSSDRYALDPDSGNAYVVAQVVIRDLANGEPGLRMSQLHEYVSDDVAKVVLQVKGQQRTLVRTTATDESGRESKTWADAQTPDKPDQTMANFLRNVDMLRPSRYDPELELSDIERVVRVEYQTAAGAPLGWLELYQRKAEAAPAGGDAGESGAAGAGDAAGEAAAEEGEGAGEATEATAGEATAGEERKKPDRDGKKRPAFYMRTELMRVPAAVIYSTASRITEDVDQIFSE